MKAITFIIAAVVVFAGCVPTLQDIQTSCAQRFDPRQDTQLYMHCVDAAQADATRRREALSEGIRRAGESFGDGLQNKQTTRCTTTCNFGTCYTTCR